MAETRGCRYMAVDLEMNQPSGEIIQIGYAVGRLDEERPTTWGSFLVRTDRPIDPFIVKLTGIDADQLTSYGLTLIDAYERLAAIFNEYACHAQPLVWGVAAISGGKGGFCDSTEIKKQIESLEPRRFADPATPYVFLNRWVDVKKVFQTWAVANGHEPFGKIAGSLMKMGLEFEGRCHDAGCDALNTFRAAAFLARFFDDIALVPGIERRRSEQTEHGNPKPKKKPEQIARELAGLIDAYLRAQGVAVAHPDGKHVIITDEAGSQRLALGTAGRMYRSFAERV